MKLFMKKLTIDNVLDALLEKRTYIEKELKNNINIWLNQENTNFNGNEKLLSYDILIFSLWVISLAIPSKEYKDMLHQKFCNDSGLKGNEIDIFYEDVDKRYTNYYHGYNKWIVNPQTGYILGRILTEIIVNQNADFSMQDALPPTNNYSLMDMMIFGFFAESFKQTLEFIGNIKKKYVIPDLR